MTARYAEGTTVSPAESRLSIERLVAAHGGSHFGYQDRPEGAVLVFNFKGRSLRFRVHRPAPTDYTYDGRRTRRTGAQIAAVVAAEYRRRWRVVLLRIKSLFEEIASGEEGSEELLLPYVILPNGDTVGEWLQPQIAQAYATGKMLELLPGGHR